MIKNIKQNQIIYISGAGRSGSTLLDILLGNLNDHLSLGELNFLMINGIIDNEYCSCGEKVQDCVFWSSIIIEWNLVRSLNNEEFLLAQNKYLRNKKSLQNLFNYFFPTGLYKALINDMELLYLTLFKVSGKKYLIDSSKNAQNLLILKKTKIPFKVIHLTRKFSGVLNSTQKELVKNPKLGLEKSLKPQKFYYTVAVWIIDNVLTILYSSSKNRVKIQYENLLASPVDVIKKIQTNIIFQDRNRLKDRGPFYPKHLVSGNKLRMSQKIHLNKTSELSRNKLDGFKRVITKFLDKF